jgi:hypothetical protein
MRFLDNYVPAVLVAAGYGFLRLMANVILIGLDWAGVVPSEQGDQSLECLEVDPRRIFGLDDTDSD